MTTILSKQKVQKGIQSYIGTYYHDNVTHFASAMQVPKNTAWSWYTGFSSPCIDNLLHICGSKGLSLSNFLLRGSIVSVSKPIPTLLSHKARKKSKRNKVDKNRVEKQLIAVLTDKTPIPPSMADVAQQLECEKRSLYNWFPNRCKRIAHRYLESKKQAGTRRLRRAADDVIRTTIALFVHDIYPGYKVVERNLKNPGILREPAVRAAWVETMKRLELRCDLGKMSEEAACRRRSYAKR